MKLLLAFILLIGTSACAQTNSSIKLYGFEERVSPGVKQKPMDGDKGDVAKPMINYLMYVSAPGSARIYPTALWIKGERLGAKLTKVSTPVTLNRQLMPGQKPTVLIPETSKQVYQIFSADADGKSYAAGDRLAQQNELVLGYKYLGKFYYATVKNFAPVGHTSMQ